MPRVSPYGRFQRSNPGQRYSSYQRSSPHGVTSPFQRSNLGKYSPKKRRTCKKRGMKWVKRVTTSKGTRRGYCRAH